MKNNTHKENEVLIEYSMSLRDMIGKVKDEPRPKFIYSGIKEQSLGVVFGPSKSGKTVFCEMLGYHIAAGESRYLGAELHPTNNKVLFISLEEHYTGRTGRNIKQIEPLKIKHGSDWLENYFVVTEEMPRYADSAEFWTKLKTEITKHSPGIVFIDSLTHLCDGQIEDSTVATGLMKKLRQVTEECQTCVCVIHHSHKLYDKPLSRDCMAGSRVVAQELDFIIGINKTLTGKRYIKEIDYRYHYTNTDTVLQFEIDSNSSIQVKGEVDEFALLGEADRRRDDRNSVIVLKKIQELTDAGNRASSKKLSEELVQTGMMSKQTMYTCLDKLINAKQIVKTGKGSYSKVA